jgi:hypothetical protein
MRPGWILPQVTKLHVEGEEHAGFGFRGAGNAGVGLREKVLFAGGCNVMVQASEDLFQVAREVLIQL